MTGSTQGRRTLDADKSGWDLVALGAPLIPTTSGRSARFGCWPFRRPGEAADQQADRGRSLGEACAGGAHGSTAAAPSRGCRADCGEAGGRWHLVGHRPRTERRWRADSPRRSLLVCRDGALYITISGGLGPSTDPGRSLPAPKGTAAGPGTSHTMSFDMSSWPTKVWLKKRRWDRAQENPNDRRSRPAGARSVVPPDDD
jgi:hypothetical protein